MDWCPEKEDSTSSALFSLNFFCFSSNRFLADSNLSSEGECVPGILPVEV